MRVNMILSLFKSNCGVSSACEELSKHLGAVGVKVLRNGASYSEFDLLDVHDPGPFSLLAVLKGKLLGKPIVMHGNTLFGDARGTFGFMNRSEFQLVSYLKAFYRYADIIIVPTEFTRKTMISELGLKSKPIYVISNGVDTKKFTFDRARRRTFRRRLGISKDKIVVYGVGHVFPRKGVLTFARIAGRFPDCEFVWAGRQFPKAFVGPGMPESPSRNLHFIGKVDFHREVLNVHCGGDIFLFPSHYENEGIVVLEAASCGRPLVLRNLEVYDRFRNGKECFRCNDDAEFSEALERLISSAKLRRTMGKAARKKALEADIRKTARKTLEVYNKLLNSKNAKPKY